MSIGARLKISSGWLPRYGAIILTCAGAPPGLPFTFDSDTIQRGLNFTLTSALGDTDLLGEIVGGGSYDQLLPHTQKLSVFGRDLLVIDLAALIRAKRAAGRPKDLEVIAELEALLAERERFRGE